MHPIPSESEFKKNTYFVDTVVAKIYVIYVHPKSATAADDCCIRTLKNIMNTFEYADFQLVLIVPVT